MIHAFPTESSQTFFINHRIKRSLMKSWQSASDIRPLLLRQGKYMILITLAPWNRVLWTKNTAKEKHPSVLMQLFISICQNVINNLVKRNVSQSNLIENKVRDVVVSLQLIAVSGVASSWYERIFRTGVIFVISRHKGGIWDYIHSAFISRIVGC